MVSRNKSWSLYLKYFFLKLLVHCSTCWWVFTALAGLDRAQVMSWYSKARHEGVTKSSTLATPHHLPNSIVQCCLINYIYNKFQPFIMSLYFVSKLLRTYTSLGYKKKSSFSLIHLYFHFINLHTILVLIHLTFFSIKWYTFTGYSLFVFPFSNSIFTNCSLSDFPLWFSNYWFYLLMCFPLPGFRFNMFDPNLLSR